MGDVLRNLTLLLAVAAFALPAAAFDGPTQKAGARKSSAAQKEQKEEPEVGGDEKGKTAALVQQAFDAGIKAYGAGKNEEALRAFEAAMRGGLPSAQMPRMLYYRGLTFRKLGKPGFAVSDLTSALWLKPGLSEAERADAIKVRALAYNEAGISNVPAVPQSSFAEAPTLPGQSKPDPAVHTAMAGGASAPAASDAPAAPTPSSGSGGVTGFFSNLFGGGSSSSSGPPPGEPPGATASIDRPPVQSEDSAGWGGTTEVAPASAPPQRAPEIASPFVTQIAAVDEPKTSATDAAPVARSTPSGKFKLQVAAVRTRSEAVALAGLVVGRHAEQLGGRKPEVDETVIGSMGTFYRVRLGPYANADEPEHLCVALRSDGFDCLVVTP
jgi:tetratricopeptide (TPR) repeat protein